jgi:G3E family GTPase
MPAKIPVTILTGFLGSGKTTLLNHILGTNHGMKFAVIENEFGEVGVDDSLINQAKFDSNEEIIEMMNGCICCTVRSDLITVLKRLLITEKRKFDGIIIETTGLADPAPVAQTFFVDESIEKMTTLDAIITVIDAKHITQHLDQVKPEGVENESVEQVAFADKLLLNKTDLVTQEELSQVRLRLRSINPSAEIIECQNSIVDPRRLLGIQGFNLNRVLAQEPEFLQDQQHLHDQTVTSTAFQITEPINIGQLQYWISNILETEGNDLLRYKGVINVAGMDQKYVFQGIHMLFTGNFTQKWKASEERVSKFVFIGRHLKVDMLRNGFYSCIAQTLRFQVGSRVEANVGSAKRARWVVGNIIKLWDEGNPYRIRLKDGNEVWGPVDDDEVVRLAINKNKNKKKK